MKILREEAGTEGTNPPAPEQTHEPEQLSGPPSWFTEFAHANDERWQRLEDNLLGGNESEDDGIESVEELPDLLEDVVEGTGSVGEAVGEAIEHARDEAGRFAEEPPWRDHGLFRLWGGKR